MRKCTGIPSEELRVEDLRERAHLVPGQPQSPFHVAGGWALAEVQGRRQATSRVNAAFTRLSGSERDHPILASTNVSLAEQVECVTVTHSTQVAGGGHADGPMHGTPAWVYSTGAGQHL